MQARLLWLHNTLYTAEGAPLPLWPRLKTDERASRCSMPQMGADCNLELLQERTRQGACACITCCAPGAGGGSQGRGHIAIAGQAGLLVVQAHAAGGKGVLVLAK